jgi:hypothetical protein
MRVSVVSGELKGMGWQVRCEIMAWKAVDESPHSYFSQFRVIDAPPDIPDGVYEVIFEGHTLLTEKRGGFWTMESLR